MSTDDLRKEVVGIVSGHLTRVQLVTRFVKLAMLVGGSLLAGVAQFVETGAKGFSTSQVVGIIGCALVFVGAIWSAFRESDSTDEIEAAYQLVNRAEDAEERFRAVSEVYEDMDRAANLLVANSQSLNFLEVLASSNGMDEVDLVEAIFEMVARHVALSMELTGSNEWTLCCYRAEPKAGERTALHLIEHDRAIKCDKREARIWYDGVGVAGICYASAREIIVPNFQGDGVGSLFNIGKQQRPYDQSRYQSIIAVPINVGDDPHPWGVLTATSDTPSHFTLDDDGLSYSEGARAMAKTIELAIALNRRLAPRVTAA